MLNRLKNIAKALLAITWIRRVYEGVNRFFLETFGSSRFLTHFFYFFSFITFNREQSAVLRGRRDYYRNKKRTRVTHVELRRNIHRLEKGMSMRPRRDVFAKDYISETIEFYAQATAPSASGVLPERSELSWAHDVLAKYFSSISVADPVVDRARSAFESIPATAETSTPRRIPHPQGEIVNAQVSYEQLYALTRQRRSVRWFQEKPVPRELIDNAILAAVQAPSACNRLPYEYLIYDTPELAHKVASIPFGTAGYSNNVPAIAVIVADQANYFSPRDRHAIYIDSSLSAMQFMLALGTQGVDSCVINWPDFEPLERKMQKTLGLRVTQRVIMLIAFGFADPEGMVPFSQKKELDTVRSFNVLKAGREA